MCADQFLTRKQDQVLFHSGEFFYSPSRKHWAVFSEILQHRPSEQNAALQERGSQFEHRQIKKLDAKNAAIRAARRMNLSGWNGFTQLSLVSAQGCTHTKPGMAEERASIEPISDDSKSDIANDFAIQ